MQSSRLEFGPKEDLPMFDELLKNKFTNLSDFKRPKSIACKEVYQEGFMRGVLASVLITDAYRLVADQQWEKAAVALTLARKRFGVEGGGGGANQEYFTWLSTVFSRVYLLKLLMEI